MVFNLFNFFLKIYKFIGFFTGFFFSSILDTTLGELNEWAIVGAALVVALLETISKFFYTLTYRVKKQFTRDLYFNNMAMVINNIKIGLIYGLIVDAFKLGS